MEECEKGKEATVNEASRCRWLRGRLDSGHALKSSPFIVTHCEWNSAGQNDLKFIGISYKYLVLLTQISHLTNDLRLSCLD
jgi:hypothetical protein